MSPVAWQHLSFIGKYEFCNSANIINIQKVIDILLTNSKIDFSSESRVQQGIPGGSGTNRGFGQLTLIRVMTFG